MDKNEIEKKLSGIWSQTPHSHSNEAKEDAWQAFSEQTFPKKTRKFSKQWIAVAAMLVVGLGVLGTVWFTSPENSLTNTAIVVNNTSSQKKTILLPDGSSVELQPGSELAYARDFAKSRTIQLKGDGYFKVKKNKLNPFVLTCGETITTVLGTAFTVEEKSNSGVEVRLFEGKVQMNVLNEKDSWILLPGERFVFHQGQVEVQPFNRFTDFNEAPLSEIVSYIQTNYGYSVSIPQHLLAKKTTLRISQREELDVIVHLLANMYDLNVSINHAQKTIQLH